MRLHLSDLTLQTPAPAGGGAAGTVTRCPDWLAQAGAEIAMPLTAAIERLQSLSADRPVDPGVVDALQRDLGRARRAAITVQQLARMTGDRVRQFPEKVGIAALLRMVLDERRAAALSCDSPRLDAASPVAVVADPSLLYSLLHTLVDWALDQSASTVELAVDHDAQRQCARLRLGFRLGGVDATPPAAGMSTAHRLETLQWQLVCRLAATMGVALVRDDGSAQCRLAVEFPRAVADTRDVRAEANPGFAPSTHAKPLAGHHVLVIAPRRTLRQEVLDAIRPIGLLVDVVASLDEARAFCREGLPHAVVADALLGRDRLLALQRELLAEAPRLPVIEVAEDGESCAASASHAMRLARVRRESIADALPAALIFELMRDD